jgi:hypothetical protein
MHGNRRHGHKTKAKGMSPTYSAWINMTQRCNNPKRHDYPRYGGRGISVCKRWHMFENFLADMGERPSLAHSVERKKNWLGYSPANCQWATLVEQARNRSNNHRLRFDGKDLPLSAWAEEVGIRADTIRWRIKLGWSVDRALTQPVRLFV